LERRRKGTRGEPGQPRRGRRKGFSFGSDCAAGAAAYAAEVWIGEGSGGRLRRGRHLCRRGPTGPWTGRRGFRSDAGGRGRQLVVASPWTRVGGQWTDGRGGGSCVGCGGGGSARGEGAKAVSDGVFLFF
jgi:hypothetical protein